MERLNPTTFRATHGNLEVVVGDEKQSAFFPRVKLKRWDNEVNFSVGLVHEGGQHHHKNGRIHYEADDLKAEFYPRNLEQPNDFHENDQDAFEFSVTLHKKPVSNLLKLSIQTKGLAFYYQSPLTPKEAKKSVRPENVIGSYAVYHRTKAHNKYETGKAFHIFRPWAEDADGTRVWCELNIPTNDDGHATKDYMTIKLPEEFLASASYPVLVDPTFGYLTQGASNTSLGNTITVLSNQVGDWGQTAVIGGYESVASSGSTVRTQWALYRSSDHGLVTNSVESTVTSNLAVGNYAGFAIGTPVTTATYDIAVWGNLPTAGEHSNIYYDTQTNAGQNLSQSYVTNGWPSTLSGTSTDNNRYSLYVTVTATPIVRLAAQDASGNSSAATVSATYPNTPTQNNLLVAAVYSNKGAGINTISGWTMVQEAVLSSSAQSASIFAKIAGASESATVSASASAAVSMYIGIYEYTGAFLATASTVVGLTETSNVTNNIASGTGAGTSTSVTVGATNDLLFAVAGFAAGSTSAQSWSGGFNTILSQNGRLTTADQIVANTTSTTFTASLTWTTSRGSGVAVAAFRVAPAKPTSMLGVG